HGTHEQHCCSIDEGHDRPEIHPFDAVWFRTPSGNGWRFGVFQDDSNRYNGSWSPAPRDLTFKFPFRFDRSSYPICARLGPARRRDGTHVIVPVNVTTDAQPQLDPEQTELRVGDTVALQIGEE